MNERSDADRDGDSLVVGHVGDVRCRSSEVGGDELFKDGVAGRVQVDGGVVCLGERLVRVIQQQVDHHVLPTFNRISRALDAVHYGTMCNCVTTSLLRSHGTVTKMNG